MALWRLGLAPLVVLVVTRISGGIKLGHTDLPSDGDGGAAGSSPASFLRTPGPRQQSHRSLADGSSEGSVVNGDRFAEDHLHDVGSMIGAPASKNSTSTPVSTDSTPVSTDSTSTPVSTALLSRRTEERTTIRRHQELVPGGPGGSFPRANGETRGLPRSDPRKGAGAAGVLLRQEDGGGEPREEDGVQRGPPDGRRVREDQHSWGRGMSHDDLPPTPGVEGIQQHGERRDPEQGEHHLSHLLSIAGFRVISNEPEINEAERALEALFEPVREEVLERERRGQERAAAREEWETRWSSRSLVAEGIGGAGSPPTPRSLSAGGAEPTPAGRTSSWGGGSSSTWSSWPATSWTKIAGWIIRVRATLFLVTVVSVLVVLIFCGFKYDIRRAAEDGSAKEGSTKAVCAKEGSTECQGGSSLVCGTPSATSVEGARAGAPSRRAVITFGAISLFFWFFSHLFFRESSSTSTSQKREVLSRTTSSDHFDQQEGDTTSESSSSFDQYAEFGRGSQTQETDVLDRVPPEDEEVDVRRKNNNNDGGKRKRTGRISSTMKIMGRPHTSEREELVPSSHLEANPSSSRADEAARQAAVPNAEEKITQPPKLDAILIGNIVKDMVDLNNWVAKSAVAPPWTALVKKYPGLLTDSDKAAKKTRATVWGGDKEWNKWGHSVFFKRYPGKMSMGREGDWKKDIFWPGYELYFDTVFWSPWNGAPALGANAGSTSTFLNEYVISRMGYVVGSNNPPAKKGDLLGPNEVRQTGLGACWLYDAIQDAMRLSLVRASGESVSGVYRVTLFDPLTNMWRPVFVDDRVPSRKDYWHPLLGASMAHSLAGGVILKAFAKLAGSYESLTSGLQSQAAQRVTGGRRVLLALAPYGVVFVRND